MSRIYYRGGMSPFETFSPGYILTHNVIGTNVGNFLYLNGVLRSLMIDDNTCLLYTSDAADDTPCVDLGGRRSVCLLYTSPSPRDRQKSRMPSSA